MEPRLRVQLLGDFHIFYDGEPIEGIASSRVQQLLAYLLITQDTPQSRYSLAFRFWPDSSESQALTNLRNILYYMRGAVPGADLCLEVNKRSLRWRSDAPYTCDVIDFERKLKVINKAEKDKDQDTLLAEYENLIHTYTGDLLPTCYEDWILLLRENYRLEYITKCQRYIVA